jgi:hypothetical protein
MDGDKPLTTPLVRNNEFNEVEDERDKSSGEVLQYMCVP